MNLWWYGFTSTSPSSYHSLYLSLHVSHDLSVIGCFYNNPVCDWLFWLCCYSYQSRGRSQVDRRRDASRLTTTIWPEYWRTTQRAYPLRSDVTSWLYPSHFLFPGPVRPGSCCFCSLFLPEINFFYLSHQNYNEDERRQWPCLKRVNLLPFLVSFPPPTIKEKEMRTGSHFGTLRHKMAD